MSNTKDNQRPWQGLSSFSEKTAHYFFGREKEIQELHNRIEENALTILYGQSGLGKTSLLRAGLLPQLKEKKLQPVILRLHFDLKGETLLQQTKKALKQCLPDHDFSADTLWQSLHHKQHQPQATPVLIFDQFEEIFTLGKSEPKLQQQTEQWLEEIADLVQNRPPKKLEQALQKNRKLARDYNFSPVPFKLLLTLREDYLSQLENWKTILPALTQNRMGLELLNGTQALQAVLGPAQLSNPSLIEPKVAKGIICRAASLPKETPIAEIQAVPPILSLLCEQLNNARIQQEQTQINNNLVAEESDDILQSFYEESFKPFAKTAQEHIRNLIEDKMVTVGGYRNPVAWDDAEAFLKKNGINKAKKIFTQLIQRRLITVEEHGISRLEITHDVLLPIIIESRKIRQEEKAKQELKQAERQAQIEAAKRAKMRNLLIVCCILLVLSIFTGGFAVKKMQEAKSASQKAQRAEQQAIQAQQQEKQAKERALASTEAERKAKEKAQLARAAADRVINSMLYDVRDKLQERNMTHILDEVTTIASTYFESFPQELKIDDPRLIEKASAHITAASNALELGKYKKAKTENDKGYSLLKRLAANHKDNLRIQRHYAISISNKSDIIAKTLSPELALPYAKSYIELSENILTRKKTEKHQQDLALSYSRYADLINQIKGAKAALPHYEKSFAMTEKAYQRNPSLKNATKHAFSHSAMTQTLLYLQGAEAAMPHLKQYTKLMQQIYEQSPNSIRQKNLAYSLFTKADILNQVKGAKPALKPIKDAVFHARQLHQKNASMENVLLLSKCYRMQATIKTKIHGAEHALNEAQKSVSILEPLYNKNPTPNINVELSLSEAVLANLTAQTKGEKAALPHAKKNYQLCKLLYQKNPNLQNTRNYAISVADLGSLILKIDGWQAALNYYEEYLKLSKSNYENIKSLQHKRDYALAYSRMGDLYFNSEKSEKSLIHYDKYAKITKEIYENNPSSLHRRDLAISHQKLMFYFNKQKHYKAAYKHIEKNMKLMKKIHSKDPSDQNTREYAASLSFMTDYYLREKQVEKAEEYAKKDLKLIEQLYGKNTTIQNKKELALSLATMSKISEQLKDAKKALSFALRDMLLTKQIYEEQNSIKHASDYAFTTRNVARLYLINKNFDRAIHFDTLNLKICQDLFKRDPIVKRRVEIIIAHENLALTYSKKRLNQPNKERQHLEAAKTHYETLKKQKQLSKINETYYKKLLKNLDTLNKQQ